jgi:starch phosphorylase
MSERPEPQVEDDDAYPPLPDDLPGLAELARNLWWSWHPDARMLFKRLDRLAWKESGHNPVKMLRALPAEVLKTAARNPDFSRHSHRVLARFKRDLDPSREWKLEETVDPRHYPCAYFSAEYGLHHSLPLYAGGLGFLAGDFLKEMSDIGVPLIAVGFMYPEGYVSQRIRGDGWQEDADQPLDREAASISKVLDAAGRPLLVEVPLFDPLLHVAVWRVSVGRIGLFLLDTGIPENAPDQRKISGHLYVGDLEGRLRQEIVLGIGGSRALAALGIRHSILHLNEGHAAFALLERVREHVEGGMSYEQAVRKVRLTSVFTTHTPVPAGHDVFPIGLMERYFHSYWPALGLDREGFFALGRHPEEADRGFNMTAFALRTCGRSNAVSHRHAEVARRMWKPLWPDRKENDVPIEGVTNGIHLRSWLDPRLQRLFEKYLGPRWLEDQDREAAWKRIDEIPDEELWEAHYRLKIKLIDAVRDRARERWATRRADPALALAEGIFLDPAMLTVGFARRFATYKRADLILSDMERLKRLVNDRRRPVQFIFAGKAHPADDPGKRILQRIVQEARNPDLGGRMAFVEDYGEQFAQYLVHGVDVWLNNPLPPLEACGTSGMKAAVNGVPHLSVLDGWWIEGYNGKNGWAIPGSVGAPDRDPARDRDDATKLYDLLEQKIVPLYYRRPRGGIPHDWVAVMKESVRSVAPHFCARRMVKEYIETYYAPALKKA